MKPFDIADFTDPDGNEDFDRMYKEMDYIQKDIERLLTNYGFKYINLTVKPGYYEGFSLDIGSLPEYFSDYSEKKDALKEITQIGKFFHKCIDSGLCVCYPGWCTSYANYSDSIREIQAAVKAMKEDVKQIQTLYQLGFY